MDRSVAQEQGKSTPPRPPSTQAGYLGGFGVGTWGGSEAGYLGVSEEIAQKSVKK